MMTNVGVFSCPARDWGRLFSTRQGQRTPLSKRRRQFLKEWPLPCQACARGPDRSMMAGQLQDFVQFLGWNTIKA